MTLAGAQNTVVPNTTYSAETGNNTSTAAAFKGTANGNIAGSNISKIDIRTLLYAGSTTKIFAHFMPWFDGRNHYNVGYNSGDPSEIHNQVSDMMSRGISGAVIDWYGRGNSFIDTTTQRFRSEAEAQGGGFNFAIMEDSGAFSTCAATPGCDFTQRFIDDLNYAYSTYASSPNYLRFNGQPVYFTFGTENYALDWKRVAAALKGNPVFVLQNSSGFTRPMSAGAFAWVQPSSATLADPMSLKYLRDFFRSAGLYPAETPFAATYKGFNDTIAPWGRNRHIQQSCGQTWLATFATTNQYFSASKQLPFIQLVTWNDYEEGTAIETGIDNCVALAGSVDSSGNLAWSISGGLENTIDHYSIFISKDGQNLMRITDVAAGQHNLNLGSYDFVAGNYSVFVKAWGQPTLTNKMSPAIAYAVASKVAPVAVLSLSTTSGAAPLTVTASTANSTSSNGKIASSVITWGDGSSSKATTASHTYTARGTYTVTGTVTDSIGMTGSTSSQVTVLAAATVAITAPGAGSQVALFPTVTAVGTSSYSITTMKVLVDGAMVAQTGNGVSAISATPKLTLGAHTVLVQMTDSSGAVTANNEIVTAVNQPPTALLSVGVAAQVAPVVASATTAGSTDADGTVVSGTINWGDGSATVSGFSASHTYSTASTYTITATVTDNYGAPSTATQQVTTQRPVPSR